MWKFVISGVFCYSLILIGLGYSEAKKKAHNECNSHHTGSKGSISLTNHNLTNGSCVWFIETNWGNQTIEQVTLFIPTIFLHEKDTVTLYRSENDTNPLAEPLRAQNGSLTIVVEGGNSLVIKVEGSDRFFERELEILFSAEGCIFAWPPEVQILNSPIIAATNDTDITCTYTYTIDQHFRSMPIFTFEQFNFTTSTVSLSGSTYSGGTYKHDPPMDFFPDKNKMTIKVTMNMAGQKNKESFRLWKHDVDSTCSGYLKVGSSDIEQHLISPKQVLNNGSIITECRWVIENVDKGRKLGFLLNKVYFDNVLDIVAVNDGASELSPPLLQVTTSNINITRSQIARTTGSYMWVAFKPKTYASEFYANVTSHEQGGYFKEEINEINQISMHSTGGNDTVFLLEVTDDKVVLLNFSQSQFEFPASISVYEGFDTTNLLTTLHGNIWYPVLSKSSKMMLIATGFNTGSFSASFKGVANGCLHMSSFANENYVLSGNCNNTCMWIIPPQDRSGSVLLLNLQYMALDKGDQISIFKLDSSTPVGEVFSNKTHLPQMMFPSNVGALVEIVRAPCSKETDNVVVVGHSSYVPACGGELSLKTLDTFHLSSPLHPDTYPLFSKCIWKLNARKDNLVHLAFNSMNLSPNHCLKVTHLADNHTEVYEGSQLREDIFLLGGVVVQFDAVDCKAKKVSQALSSSEGFVLNGTVTDCGKVMIGEKRGQFSVPSNKSLCLWKLEVPETESGGEVNIISYSVTAKDQIGNYELLVYDGDTVRDNIIKTNVMSGIWSRTNNLIFVYKRIDVTKPSSILDIKYDSISCNSSSQCDNKICMHPDWRCNSLNDCGDYSDERNCNSPPVPPEIKSTGYSAEAFWITLTAMLVLGALLGVAGKYYYERYRDGQYRRFGDISIIE